MSDPKYKDTENTIKSIRQSIDEWYKHLANAGCDKHGIGVNLDKRFSAASLTISIDSWAGYFGDSGCSSVLRVGSKPEIFKNAFGRVLTSHLIKLLKETADLLERESDEARREYIAKLKQEAAELEAIDAERSELAATA